jgi:hypothetical protein
MPWALDKRGLNRAWAQTRFAGPGDSEAYPSGAQSRFGEVEYSVNVILRMQSAPNAPRQGTARRQWPWSPWQGRQRRMDAFGALP